MAASTGEPLSCPECRNTGEARDPVIAPAALAESAARERTDACGAPRHCLVTHGAFIAARGAANRSWAVYSRGSPPALVCNAFVCSPERPRRPAQARSQDTLREMPRRPQT